LGRKDYSLGWFPFNLRWFGPGTLKGGNQVGYFIFKQSFFLLCILKLFVTFERNPFGEVGAGFKIPPGGSKLQDFGGP